MQSAAAQRGTGPIPYVLMKYRRGWRLPIAQWLQLIEHQLDADAHELDQLGQRRFVRLETVGRIDPGARDLGHVAQDFAQIAGQALRVGSAIDTEAVQETRTPAGQCPRALLDRLIL